jgi:outer membrane protein assembly factor BamB
VVPGKALPLQWKDGSGRAWRYPLPRPASGSPVVWGDRVILAQPDAFSAAVLCLSRKDGRLLWRRDVSQIGGVATRSPVAQLTRPSRCGATPVTDGRRVVVLLGSVIWCLDLEGNELWQREVENRDPSNGMPASPVLVDGLCLVALEEPPRVEALDAASGETRWSVPLDRAPRSLAVTRDGILVAASSPGWLGVRVRDGGTAWTLDRNPEGSPVEFTLGPGWLVASGAGRPAMGFSLKGDGLPVRRWASSPVGPVSLPGVFRGNHLFLLTENGDAVCLDREKGRILGRRSLRAEGEVSGNWSAPLLSGGRLYLANGSGVVTVLAAVPALDVLAVNRVGEPFSSTLAGSDGDLFLRTESALWCLREGARSED